METAERVLLDQETLLSRLDAMGEWFAAGFLSRPDAGPIPRMGAALRRTLENTPLPEYTGRRLYPHGAPIWGNGACVCFHYVQFGYSRPGYEQKRRAAQTDEERAALDAVDTVLKGYPMAAGYTHSIPHYGRILREGLDSYRDRIEAGLATARRRGDTPRAELYEALLDVLAGVDAFRRRSIEKIRTADLTARTDGQQPAGQSAVCNLQSAIANRQALLAALEHVPFQPARTFTEAMIAENFLFYLDGCDDLGRFDQDLWPCYQASRPADAEALGFIGEMWENIDNTGSWNVALGGTTRDGEPAYNDLTRLAVRAGKGRRRPNLALRLRRDAPEWIWDEALETISGGTGIPALYCEENYLAALTEAHLNLPQEDMHEFAFGGCTETMIHGRSNVGSLDDNLNLPEVFERAVHTELATSPDFECFVERTFLHIADEIRKIADRVCRNQEIRAKHQPQLIRTLLIDDCIENGREYSAGGARYNWSVINVGGLGNLIDSLVAIRELVYQRGEVDRAHLLQLLKEDWSDEEMLRRRIGQLPRYGQGDPSVDALARRVSEFVFREFLRYAPYRGGKFLASCLMFVTYATEGARVGATPDGRRAGEPIADSAGPVQGRDTRGPTAALHSTASLDMIHAPGTLVVNTRFSKKLFADREKVKALVRGYFALGGLQLQINVVDQSVLRDALEHPERHGDLVIRMGGYSEYWNNLSRALQESVLERVEHE